MRLRHFIFVFLAAVVANANINIFIDSPWNLRVGEEVPVAARVESTLEIKSVIAEVGDRRGELVFSHMGPGPQPVFTGLVSLTNLARGSYQLKVTATDIANSSNSVVRVIFLDRPPKLRVNGLTNNSVIRNPLVPVDIGCEDDDGCYVLIRGPFGTPVPYTNGVLNLTEYDHSSIGLLIGAYENTGGSFAEVAFGLNIESSSRLAAEDSAPGAILDFDQQRILYLNGGVLGLLDRTTRATTVITNFVTTAFLTPPGAVYARQPGNSTTAEVGEYPGGRLGRLSSTLRAKGSYMLWSENSILYRRNVVTSQTEVISQNAGNIDNDVTSEGDVAWWDGSYQIFLNDQQMSIEAGQDVYPLTDGTNVVWRRMVPRQIAPGRPPAEDYYIVLNNGTGEKILTKALSGQPSPGRGYQVAGGWVAYVDSGNAGQWHVWRRSPAGEKSQLSFFGSSSEIQSLNDRGEVLWINGSERYLNERKLGSFLGQAAFKGGQWHVVLGNELFLLDTEVPLSIESVGNMVVVSGTGVLESSTNLADWVEVGPVEGLMRIPRDSADPAKFYRLKR